MKHMATSLILTLGAVWLLQSCRPDFTEEIAAVDSMLSVLNAVDARVVLLDTTAINTHTEQVNFECSQLRLTYLDTSESDLQVRLDTLCAYSAMAQHTVERTRILVNELIKTRKQLTDLRADLHQGRAKKEAVATYIEVEFLYLESLSGLLDELEERFENNQIRLEQVRLELDSLMAGAIVAPL